MITAGGIVHWYVQLLFRLLLCPCRTTQHQEAPDHQQAYSSSHFYAKFFPFKLQNYCPFISPLFHYLRVFLLDEQIAIIRNHESGDGNRDLLNANPDINENNVAAVIRRYDKVWMEENSDITADGSSQDSIVRKSFERTERQFLQIKKTSNIFVNRPT